MARVMALLEQCPYCSGKLRAAPTRSHKCPHCKNTFHIWHSPDGEVFAVTEDELPGLQGAQTPLEAVSALPVITDEPVAEKIDNPMYNPDELFPFGVRKRLQLEEYDAPQQPVNDDLDLEEMAAVDGDCNPAYAVQAEQAPDDGAAIIPLDELDEDFCPECGLVLTEDMNFCPRCGLKCSRKKKLRCPGCRLVITPDMVFCPRCGSNLEPQPDQNS